MIIDEDEREDSAMMKVTLDQMLQYYDMEENPVDRIQIVPLDKDWDLADEFFVNSELLVPFKNWIISDLSCETSDRDKKPILRVSIRPAEEPFLR